MCPIANDPPHLGPNRLALVANASSLVVGYVHGILQTPQVQVGIVHLPQQLCRRLNVLAAEEVVRRILLVQFEFRADKLVV